MPNVMQQGANWNHKVIKREPKVSNIHQQINALQSFSLVELVWEHYGATWLILGGILAATGIWNGPQSHAFIKNQHGMRNVVSKKGANTILFLLFCIARMADQKL